ncbi:hypothetical protein [Brockia lithotrophica]|uniref:Uncharacterized protein n=1 Tax=Brockia lithotrophica TaxID=933949 RepID=A0A660L5C2_9BACL|nr:hypothetical protein [Brockia lithotrophica]RKQ88404.1 hypothetical protein C7438_0037 [Brockia lithotrophica]
MDRGRVWRPSPARATKPSRPYPRAGTPRRQGPQRDSPTAPRPLPRCPKKSFRNRREGRFLAFLGTLLYLAGAFIGFYLAWREIAEADEEEVLP